MKPLTTPGSSLLPLRNWNWWRPSKDGNSPNSSGDVTWHFLAYYIDTGRGTVTTGDETSA